MELLSRADVPWRVALGKVVLANHHGGATTIAGEAAAIWMELETPAARRAVQSAVSGMLEQEADVSRAVDTLIEAGVIEIDG